MTTYSDSGVDVAIEEKAAKILYAAAKKSWANRKSKLGEVIFPFDDFSGIRAIDVGALPAGTLMNMGFDGVGTKSEIASLVGRYDTLAYDLIAMVCDDAVIRGGESVLVGSILDVNTLGNDESRLGYIKQLAKGYAAAAKVADVAIINGELAQLSGHDSQSFSLNWGAAVVWFAHESRLITGYDVQPGDAIVGLAEPSMRSNGLSLVRQVLRDKYGPKWHKEKLGDNALGELALEPSTIYSPAIVEMFGGWNTEAPAKAQLHALANITGGGLPGKLGRALKPSGLGANITDPFTPNELILHCQKVGDVSDFDAYTTWHMGQGMVIVTSEPDKVMAITRKYHHEAMIIGEVTKQPDIIIANRGYFAAQSSELIF